MCYTHVKCAVWMENAVQVLNSATVNPRCPQPLSSEGKEAEIKRHPPLEKGTWGASQRPQWPHLPLLTGDVSQYDFPHSQKWSLGPSGYQRFPGKTGGTVRPMVSRVRPVLYENEWRGKQSGSVTERWPPKERVGTLRQKQHLPPK